MGTSISEAAFKCGFRVPFLPILKKLFDNMGIVLGKMDSNGFIHKNCFQARCLAANVQLKTSLFWYHIDFKRNSKNNSYYNISRRVGRADWDATNSNNRGSHEEWFYISGSKIVGYSTWRLVKPTKLIMPDLTSEEDNDYIALNGLEMGKIPRSDNRRNDWIFILWGSGNTPLHYSFSSLVLSCISCLLIFMYSYVLMFSHSSFFVCFRSVYSSGRHTPKTAQSPSCQDAGRSGKSRGLSARQGRYVDAAHGAEEVDHTVVVPELEHVEVEDDRFEEGAILGEPKKKRLRGEGPSVDKPWSYSNRSTSR